MATSRRKFLTTVLGTSLLATTGCRKPTQFSGSIMGANAAAGHRLRQGGFPEPPEPPEPPVAGQALDYVIVGGGIAGLAAARQFHRAGKSFVLLELENAAGGNSSSGQNAVSAYPWGAHYVPLPNAESREVIELFEELQLIRGHNPEPIYDEFALCSDPMERLFLHGRWQENLLPQIGITAEEQLEHEKFLAQMARWRELRGSDGKRAFAIPLDLSSQDPELLALDQLTMAQWMDKEGFNSPSLRWLVDYSCRDDYGAGIQIVSAWAGIHYFASRNGSAANASRDAVLTWPEGNGWLVQQLTKPFTTSIRSQCLVFRISHDSTGAQVDYFDLTQNRSIRLRCKGVVCATPRFVTERLLPELPKTPLQYSPWMVANLTVSQLPAGSGAAIAWDNVFFQSDSLGYVVATHQSLHPVPGQSVLTLYWPLDHLPPPEARKTALERSYAEWCELIVAELSQAHPQIAQQILHLDLWIWGHAMARPVPGFLWSQSRRQMQAPLGPIVFAHSDMSGISIFEEAFTRGTQAALSLLA